MKRFFTLLAAFVATTMLGISSAQADLVLGDSVGIDFGSIAPAAGINFNQFDAFNNSIADGASLAHSAIPGSTALVDLSGAGFTVVGAPLDFTVENQTGQSTSRANVTNGTTGPAPFDDSTVFQDSIISNNQGAAPLDPNGYFNLTFSGLDDTLVYDLTGGFDGNNANFDSILSAGAGAGTVAGGGLLFAPGTNNYVTLSGLETDGSGNLTVAVTRNSLHANIGAITLTAVDTIAVPEPSSAIALLGLFGLAMTKRRRS